MTAYTKMCIVHTMSSNFQLKTHKNLLGMVAR